MVWQARRLSSAQWGKKLSCCSLAWKLTSGWCYPPATEATAYRDPEQGEWTALKIARSGYGELLLKELQALRRVGRNLDIRLYFPTAGYDWPTGFPCIVMEWVTGEKLSESEAYTEKDGLEIVLQLAELLLTLHLVAPDIVPTDSLKADGVFIDREAERCV